MNKSFPLPVQFLLISVFITTGCVTLKPVSDFSSASVNGIMKFEEITYSFYQNCLDRCAFDAMRTFEIERDTECDCRDYKKADQVTRQIYNGLKSYFKGLSDLSANKLTSYNFKSLENSLIKGDFGKISIEDEHVKAFSSLSGIVLRSTTDLYRRNMIKKYVEEANVHVQVLLEKFQFIIQENLKEELDFRKERLYEYYTEIKLGNTLSEYEKGKAAGDYWQQISAILSKQDQMIVFARSLTTISEGHQWLYDHRNKMSARELAAELAGYICDIQDIISEFNKLTD